ncbi:MAG: diguanylate cyclase [Clostridia bacterium]|nr:diguanylate cyclase [Clostridia bacterium]
MNTKVLIVDDNNKNLRLLNDILVDEGYTVYTANNGLPVVEMTHNIKPDVILLDIMMPGIDGFEVCKRLKKDYEIEDIPVIMVTAKTDGNDIKMGLELGAFDYIKKPVDEVEVIARVQSALRFKKNQDTLKEMAMKDSLTGVYNHALLIELFEKEMTKTSRKVCSIAFVMADIDYFKNINDTYGHTVGDKVLRGMSHILSTSVRKSDIVGRYGGEEFGMVLPDISADGAYNFCERIRKSIEGHSFNIDGENINVTLSMGVAIKTCKNNLRSSEVIKMADDALYRAKRNGRNRVEVYVAED